MAQRHRSPNYPTVSLKAALEYLDGLYNYTKGRHWVPATDAIESAWSMKRGSAYGLQVVAALKSFGLIEDKGSTSSRQIQISDFGMKIRGGHSDRDKLIKEAALKPPLHQELWDTFSGDEGMPPPATFRQYLLFDRDGHRFNEATVGDFIAEFLDTISFAQLAVEDKMEDDDGTKDKIRLPPNHAKKDDDAMQEPEVSGQSASLFGAFADPFAKVFDNKTPPKQSLPANEPAEMTREMTTLDEGLVTLMLPKNLSAGSVQDFDRWTDDLSARIHRRAGGRRKSVSLPNGGMLHLVSHPGSDKWCIKSYDFSWIAGMQLLTATVHAAANKWESLEFETPEKAAEFVASKPIPSVVPQQNK